MNAIANRNLKSQLAVRSLFWKRGFLAALGFFMICLGIMSVAMVSSLVSPCTKAYADTLEPTDTVTLTIIGGATSTNPSSNNEYITLVNKQYSGEEILRAAQLLDASKTYSTLNASDLLATAWKAGDIATYALGAVNHLEQTSALDAGGSHSTLVSLTSKEGVVYENWVDEAKKAEVVWEFYQSGRLLDTALTSASLKPYGTYQFCWEGRSYAGLPQLWSLFYLEHVPTGPLSHPAAPSVVLSVVGETIPASQEAPASYDVWVNRRVLMSDILSYAQQTRADATLESLTMADLLATEQAQGGLDTFVVSSNSDGGQVVSITNALGVTEANCTSPQGDLCLYWTFCEDNYPSVLSISQAKLEAAHHYQLVWNMETTALAPTNWTNYYTDCPAEEAKISPAAGYNDGWNRTASGAWVYKKNGALLSNGWAHIGGAWYHFDTNGLMQTGWLKQGATWYYLTEAGQSAPEGSAAVGWRKVHGTWYYFRSASEGVECSMVASSWLHKGSTWYYLTDSGAMATGWLSVKGTWYYLVPDSGAMQTGWQRVRGYWYYLQPGSGAMRTGWLSLGGVWYYLAPGSGAMQTGWYWVGSKCYYSVTSGAMAHDRWVGSYWVGSDGAWVPSADR